MIALLSVTFISSVVAPDLSERASVIVHYELRMAFNSAGLPGGLSRRSFLLFLDVVDKGFREYNAGRFETCVNCVPDAPAGRTANG